MLLHKRDKIASRHQRVKTPRCPWWQHARTTRTKLRISKGLQ